MEVGWNRFKPKIVKCFQEGYSKSDFLHDLLAGLSVGVIALPLAIAFGIASGVTPERGLYTAIVAGFLISLLGGSRVQIGGPTGAFVVIIYGIIQKHGYEGLAVATILAGLMMIFMGLARFGVLLKFIPFPVTTGFTTGIALVIASFQVKDFLGLDLEKVPPEFLEKCTLYCQVANTWNIWAVLIGLATLLLIIFIRRMIPKAPGALLAIIATTLGAFYFDLPVETIQSKFGDIPNSFPAFSPPFFSYDLIKKVFPDAISIALLGSIESLLSALVADGMTGHKHRSNQELIAQGIGNIGSILFGGIPATGAIARTSANVRMGAKTPLAGIIHAITLLLLMLCFAPLAGKIPLAALSGILLFVAWNMSELPHFIKILKGQKGDAAILLITFLLTVLIDLTVAVQVGVLLGAVVFVKRMTDRTTVKIYQNLVRENARESGDEIDDIIPLGDIPPQIAIFEIVGPFFYSVSDLLDEALFRMEVLPKVFLLRVHKAPLFDATGLHAIEQFVLKCRKKGIRFIISDLTPRKREIFSKAGIIKSTGENNTFSSIKAALKAALQE